jgi:hypothetical protein
LIKLSFECDRCIEIAQQPEKEFAAESTNDFRTDMALDSSN